MGRVCGTSRGARRRGLSIPHGAERKRQSRPHFRCAKKTAAPVTFCPPRFMSACGATFTLSILSPGLSLLSPRARLSVNDVASFVLFSSPVHHRASIMSGTNAVSWPSPAARFFFSPPVLSLGLGTGCSSDRGDSSEALAPTPTQAPTQTPIQHSTWMPAPCTPMPKLEEIATSTFRWRLCFGRWRTSTPTGRCGRRRGHSGRSNWAAGKARLRAHCSRRGASPRIHALENRSAAPVTVHIGDIEARPKTTSCGWPHRPSTPVATLPPGDTLAHGAVLHPPRQA